ncbi:MFS transporter [Alistipes sp.]|uniref:MFS transporter n=3 Tax=Alistipes TaxID=239759 RepID=UPI0023F11F9E|nr:MFS transporter [Alistipes sp.]
MWFIELGTICVTVAVVVRVWWLVVQVLRARNKRRLLSRMFGVVSDSPDFIGISAICHDIDSVSQVADLLDVEYASYELLVVMDARLKPELFHEMLRHYRMMRVDYHPFEACSQLGVRGFYRSQTRGVNRLTLLDQMEAFSAVSSDAAVRAASYDYILPIGRNLRLKRGAIDRLAMELAVHPIHSISFVRTAVGPSLRLYAREYVGRLGRFDRADGYELSRKERITLYEPLFYELRPSRYVWILTLTGMALLAGCAIAAWSFGWLPMTLLLLDILLLWGLFLWLGAIGYLGLGFFNTVIWANITDVIDDQEVQTGHRDDGTVYAVYSFARKVGQALAGGIGGWALQVIGYEPAAAAQTDAVRRGLYTTATLVPAIGFFVVAAILWFVYPLDKRRVEKNVEELKKKHLPAEH